MAAKFCIFICTVAVANADSWYKTITPSENHNLCLDLPGSNPYNGNMLWLWECNGMDGQIWVFDNYQIRYGADENYCIDARDMSDGVQLMLWECTGMDQQTWGYDGSAQTVYIDDGSSTCLDLWEDQQWNGQWLHVWQCNGLNNQQWSLWDAPAPSPPGPPPSPGGGDFFSSCDDQSGGAWPVFNDQSELSNDNQWAQYFACVYGEVPSFGYPICLSGFRMLHLSCVSQAGLNIGEKSNPSSPGDYYMANSFKHGLSFGAILHNDCSGQCFGSNQWFEGLHCSSSGELNSAWYYFATGSGVWLWSGSTKAWSTRNDFSQEMGFGTCIFSDFECGGTLFTTAKSQYGYDTIQYLNEHNKIQGGGNPMIIATEGVGKNSCVASPTPWMAGWGATQNCDCDQSKACQNCNGFAYNNCGETVVAV